ncbi:MAG: serine hydrolase domain-containing protein [Pseudomonadota bacterium]
MTLTSARCTLTWRISILIATVAVANACAIKPHSKTAAPGVENDTILERNMAAAATRPGPTDLAWRQPKTAIAGSTMPARETTADTAPMSAALQDAADYSDALGGIGLMVSRAGKTIVAHFPENVDATTHFASYSMHKSVLALAVLAAIEDGYIANLDAPVGRDIAAWSGDARGAITYRQLLNHQSGLEHFPISSERGRDLAYSGRVTETALSHQLVDQPGGAFNYNNVNSQIAGIALIGALSANDLDYAQYLSKRLWKPLGNHAAALWIEAPGGNPRFFSGLEAGLGDWLRLGELIANEGRFGETQVLSAASIAALITPATGNPAYGLHVWLGDSWQRDRRYGPSTTVTVPHKTPYLAPGVVFFDGFGGQRVYVVPEHQLVIARAGAVRLDYDDSTIVNAVVRGELDERADTIMAAYARGDGESQYLERFEMLMSGAGSGGRGLGGYDPVTPLKGVQEVTPLPRGEASDDWLDEETADWLETLGNASNTQAMVVWHDGRIVWERYYDDVTPESLVISRSLSKPLSVIAVARAIALGYLPSLDVEVAQYLSEWRGSDKGAITIRQLLQMRSGLAPQSFAPKPDDIMNRAYLHPYHEAVILSDYPLVTEPGTRYDYSNANGEILAVILERATGRRYEDWIGEAVLRPLGAAGGQAWLNRPGGTLHAGCCALLPTETYLRLALLLLNDGAWQGQQLLPPGFVAEMTSATALNPHVGMGVYVAGPYIEYRGAANPEVSFGKTLHTSPYLDKDLYLFDGNGNQVIYIVPRHDLIVLRVGNSPSRDTPWDNSLLINRVLQALASATGASLIEQPRN